MVSHRRWRAQISFPSSLSGDRPDRMAASSAVIYVVIVVITLRMLYRGLRQIHRQET